MPYDAPRLKARWGEGTQVKKRGANAGGDIPAARVRGLDTSTKQMAALVDVDKPLTSMQKAFVKHWAAGETIPAASRLAGYSDGGTMAYRLVYMPNVLALYDKEKKAYEEASGMSRKRVMDMLVEGFEMAKMVSEPASMVSAAREIGRMCGYYEPVKTKVDITINGKVMLDKLNTMSDEDLFAIVEASSKAMAQAAQAKLPAPEQEDEYGQPADGS